MSEWRLSWGNRLLRDGAEVGRVVDPVIVADRRCYELQPHRFGRRQRDLIDLASGAPAGWYASRQPFETGTIAVGHDVFEWRHPNVFRTRRMLRREGTDLAIFRSRALLSRQLEIEVTPAGAGLPWLVLTLLVGCAIVLGSHTTTGVGGSIGGDGGVGSVPMGF
jgi:hypothetical protein